jgi:DNA-binding transcriptional regulator YhcF (GntR family)
MKLEISRDTAEKTYRQLKQLGVVVQCRAKDILSSKTDFNNL